MNKYTENKTIENIIIALGLVLELTWETIKALAITAIITGILLLIFFVISGCVYKLDHTNCKAMVEGKTVYEGKCHFLRVKSIGQNGKTKNLIIKEDIMGFITKDEYICDDIKVLKSGD